MFEMVDGPELTEERLLHLVADGLKAWDPMLFARAEDSQGAAFIALDIFKKAMEGYIK